MPRKYTPTYRLKRNTPTQKKKRTLHIPRLDLREKREKNKNPIPNLT